MATRPVDEKIVAMKMDNSDFVKKASETTKLMGRFTQLLNKIPGINIGRTANDFQNIQKSVNGIDMSRLGSAVDKVASRFSTLGIVGTTALVNIANKAVDAGLSMAKNLTVAPIMDGFREYETKIGSIQTILANTAKFGTNVDDVTKSLQRLNAYADKTIFSFGDMTKNIGLFTNAGLGLKESVSMIKGFSNAAAASGAKAEQMASAAYQLSQGLSSGFIITQDWMSLTNAGMGNDNMKRDLIALGHAMGTLKKSTDETLTSWKETLTDDKWLTKDVFSKYLQAMAGDLDKAKLEALGLTKAQAELLLQNAKTGEDAATKVRTFTQMVGTIVESIGSGWAETWEIIFGGFEDATKLWSGFTEIISEPFNALTASRNKFLQTLKDKGVFVDLFTTLGTAIYIVGKVVTALAGGFDKAFSSDRVGMVTSFVKGFKNLVSAITPSQATLVKMGTIFQALGSDVRVVMKVLGEVGKIFLNLIPDGLGAKVLTILETLAKMNLAFSDSILKGNGLTDAFKDLGNVFSWIGARIGDAVNGIGLLVKSMSDVFTILSTGQESVDSSVSKKSTVVVWLTAIGTAAKVVVERIKSLRQAIEPVSKTFNAFFSAIVTGFNWFKDKLSVIGKAIKENMPSGTTLFAGGFVAALITISGLVLKRINDISKMFSEWGKIGEGIADTFDSISGVLNSFALNLKANALLTASIAVGALAVSILLLSRIKGKEIGTSLGAIVGSLTAVIGAMTVMDKFNVTGGIRVTASIVGMAVALSVMSIALKQFGSLNPQELTKGLIGVVTVMGALAGSFALMGKFNTKNVAVSAAQIVAMSISIMIIAKAVKELSSIDPADLAKGVGGLAAILLAISSAFALMGKFGGKGSSATALQFVAIAGSVLMLVGAIKTISAIKTDDLLIGLGTITAILATVAGFATLTSGTGLIKSAAGLLAISVAINALIIPLFALGSFPLDKLGIGLLGMSTALLAIAAASTVMNGSLTGAASILAMAVALNLLIIPIATFAAMGWGPMLIGVAGLALSLGALAGVSLLLSPATIPLLAFSVAIGVMGVAMLAAGAGMTLFSTGLLALAGMTSAAVATIVTTIGALITGLVSLIPTAVKFVVNIIKQVATAIRDNAPEIVGLIAQTIVNILTTISTYIPKFIAAAVKIITALLDGIASEAPKLLHSMVNLLITLVETMAKTIKENGPKFVNAFLDLIKEILIIMVEAGTSVIKAMYGWIPGVNKAMNKVSETAGNAIDKHLEAAKIAEQKGTDFADGLSSKQGDVKTASVDLSNSANEGLETADSKKSGGNFVTRFIDGLLGRKDDVKKASTELASAANDGTREELDINSPSGKGIENGEHYGDGLAIGIDNSTDKVKKSAAHMSDGIASGLGGTYNMIKDKLFLKDKDVKENDKKVSKVVDTYSKGSNTAATKSVKSQKSAMDDSFKKFKDWLDDRKYYNQITLDQELAAWQKQQKKYKEGTEERKEADREAYRLQKELIKQKEDAEKASFDKSKAYIDDRKYYNKVSLNDELLAWERIQKRFKQGTEERKEADREVYRLQKELIKQKEEAQKAAFDRSKQFIDDEKNVKHISLMNELSDWERVQKRYKEGTEERKQADQEVLRVKNEINQKLMSINDEYLQNVKSTNDKLIQDEKSLRNEYQRTYDDRVKSISNFVGLFNEVKKQDKDNPITGEKLLTNLQDQTNALATWSDDLKRLTQKGIDDGLLKELEAMGPSAANEIAALNQLTGAQLDQYVELWRTKNELARTQATQELEPLRESTNKQIDQLRIDAAAKLDEYKSEWAKKISEIRINTNDEFVGLKDDMNTIGGEIIDGLKKGLSDNQGPLYDKVKSIANGIVSTIKNTLQIKSPSRVMMSLGKFAGEGFASGLTKSVKTVSDRSKELASSAVNSINEFISTFQQPSFDNEIHLKAVLDDSDVNDKLSAIKNAPLLSLGTTNGLVSSAKATFRQNGSSTPNSEPTKPSTVDSSSKADSNRPIVIQSILNGRVIAEETFDDMNQLMGNRTNLDLAMRGV